MAIEIKELSIKMSVKDPHSQIIQQPHFDRDAEKRIIETSVEKVLKILERKSER